MTLSQVFVKTRNTQKYTHVIIKQLKTYCNPFDKKLTDEGKDIKWKIWQQKVIKIILEKPNPRTIHWYYEETGNTGKTFLTRFLISAHHSCLRVENAKSADLKFAYNGENIVMFDLSRSIENIFNYKALESLKNGAMFSPKYESKSKVYSIPHVFVFANWKPDMIRLSLDRWKIVHITDNDNLFTNNTWNDIIAAHMLLDLAQSDNTHYYSVFLNCRFIVNVKEFKSSKKQYLPVCL